MNKIQLTALALVGTGLFFQSCQNKGAQQGQQGEVAVPVSAVEVTQEEVSGSENYPAVIVPINETELRAEVSGYITNIFVTDGASVAKGDRLYEIDGTRYAAAVDQAKANLKIAEANLDKVKRDVQRYRKLAEQDAIAKQTLDYAETDLNNQEAQVLAAKANLTTAATNLNRSVIRAPFSGTIGISQVRNGALVSAGTTLLNTISTVNPITAEFQVPERNIAHFVSLQKSGNQSALKLRLSDGQLFDGAGQIITIDRAVDEGTNTIKVRAKFNNPGNQLRAGMNATITVIEKSSTPELVIPYKAVQEQLGTYNVFVIGDSSKVQQRNISIGLKFEDKVVVKDGLKVGDKVVTEGVMNLKEGVKVTEKSAGN
ncbi:efflux transporter, RND family, MFP subunit [Pseudopedobacter saltans DSM 12145]|uniref:Efflux transporter, RND family, MFP subunit n=1 Tax=Pseudopedobacter saltans (strain ATCC 51119 / DSM 12145 / JCM 21818 / CCUG 39354 / LMG 10337 / NBRC 100064 / NCIMB 13643) TaxID=762903 RepID=F0SAS0_PSESL|nr:efflux RND transporter periplasmic adaptor subunit [Pseudopedobacter saltans]ADY53691.1 efflux transporter, RND family, MFP subunit [Pseudopedobacter saltans DSM 12145]